eukprot:m.13755 g.13755  ORF g.13755 m.13755 type:complete len:65 (+) comp9835_c0_seq1:198-392(+)
MPRQGSMCVLVNEEVVRVMCEECEGEVAILALQYVVHLGYYRQATEQGNEWGLLAFPSRAVLAL